MLDQVTMNEPGAWNRVPREKKEVVVIAANPRLNPYSGAIMKMILNTAAYARVSTDKEDQINSYEAQIAFYTDKIQNDPEMNFVEMYADEGITGTSLKNRKHFNRMIRDCRRGKIDMILCKSVSRFARNTVDCLEIVRDLRARGIAIYFEKENVNTLKESSEFLLTLFSGFAQAESESLSANVRWGKRKSMMDGNVIFQYKRLYGYEKGEDNEPKVIPAEAVIVERIYKDFYAGYSLGRIKDELEEDKITPPFGAETWSKQVIKNILANEKYAGDALLQKTYRIDCINKIVRKNNGELPMYLVKNSHDAIIPRDLYNKVQEEMARRKNIHKTVSTTGRTAKGKFSSKYALTGRLVCGECGTPYRRCTWTRRDKTRQVVWRCINQLENAKQYCKDAPTIDEYKIHSAVINAINHLKLNISALMDSLQDGITQAIGKHDISEIARLEKSYDEFEVDINKVLNDKDICASTMNAEMQRIVLERESIKASIHEKRRYLTMLRKHDAHAAEVMRVLESISKEMDEFDNVLVAQAIDTVTVESANHLTVKFKNGIEITSKIVL